MSNAALAFLSGLGGGYMQGKQREEEKARQAAKDKRDQEEHDARMEDFRRKKDSNTALRLAAEPLTVKTGQEAPSLVPNDEEGNAMPAVNTFEVQGKRYDNRTQADAAVTAGSTPQAIRGRQVQALQGIDPERAMKLDADAMTLDEKARKLQDEGVFDGLKAFRMGDAAGMKAALNKSGQYKIDGDVTLTPVEREVPGVGKITTYNASFNAVGPDGKIVPRQVNSHDLSLQMMPYEKAIELTQKGTKEAREAKKDDSIIKENEAKAGYYTAAAGAQGAKADAAANGSGKPFKLDEDDKLRLTEASKGVQEATKAYGEALKVLMPGQKPEDSPAVAFAAQQLKLAKRAHLKTNIELGQISPESLGNQVMGAATNLQDVMRSLSKLSDDVGPEFADKVLRSVYGSEKFKQLDAADPLSQKQRGGSSATATKATKMGAGPAPKRTRTEMTEAPPVTAGGFPRDPNARAAKFQSAAQLSGGIQKPQEQLVKDASAAAAAAKTAAEAYRVVDMPGFQFLPKPEQLRIAELTKGS